eukprot:EG_transcript_14014
MAHAAPRRPGPRPAPNLLTLRATDICQAYVTGKKAAELSQREELDLAADRYAQSAQHYTKAAAVAGLPPELAATLSFLAEDHARRGAHLQQLQQHRESHNREQSLQIQQAVASCMSLKLDSWTNVPASPDSATHSSWLVDSTASPDRERGSCSSGHQSSPAPSLSNAEPPARPRLPVRPLNISRDSLMRPMLSPLLSPVTTLQEDSILRNVLRKWKEHWNELAAFFHALDAQEQRGEALDWLVIAEKVTAMHNEKMQESRAMAEKYSTEVGKLRHGLRDSFLGTSFSRAPSVALTGDQREAERQRLLDDIREVEECNRDLEEKLGKQQKLLQRLDSTLMQSS